MKSNFIMPVAIVFCLIMACTKGRSVDTTPAGSSTSNNTNGRANRLAGPGYSQSIPIDTANKMIQSYLNSVHYPAQDTALRSLSFDADTLRAYLSDPHIVTLKFMIAHQQAYTNTAASYGTYAGLKPNAITLIIVGMDDDNGIVRNKSNGVFEHCLPCPTSCNSTSALLY